MIRCSDTMMSVIISRIYAFFFRIIRIRLWLYLITNLIRTCAPLICANMYSRAAISRGVQQNNVFFSVFFVHIHIHIYVHIHGIPWLNTSGILLFVFLYTLHTHIKAEPVRVYEYTSNKRYVQGYFAPIDLFATTN